MSKENWLKAAGITLLLLVAGTEFAVGLPQQSVTLTGFQALLFNSKTGAFSADVLSKHLQWGNVPAGEFASVSTLVIVKVQVPNSAPTPKGVRVRLTAIEKGSIPFAAKTTKEPDRVILDRTEALGPVNADGVTNVGFWLSATGCRSITLKAFLVGVTAAKPITEVLPFACYE